jgi:hypothetical protein
MSLNPDFHFSASSLQDYVDCPRRFELRYIERLAWPALESEPVLEHELHMRQGYVFHKLVQQVFLGLGDSIHDLPDSDGELKTWWDNFRQSSLVDELPQRRYPEHPLTARIGDYRFVAKYDLLAVDPGQKVIIADWKTSRRRTRSDRLKLRLQTRLYPFLIVKAGRFLNGGKPVAPDQVHMVYWFAAHPQQPEWIAYSQHQFEADQQYLTALAQNICERPAGEFPLTVSERSCGFCVYRSLCQRGVCASDWAEWDDDGSLPEGDIDLDFDQIGEIAF